MVPRTGRAHRPRARAGPGAQESPERLEVEHDNLRAALGTALAHDPEQAQQLAASMWRFWLARSYFVEGARWIDAALDRGPKSGFLRARVLIGACAVGVRRGDQSRIVEMAEGGLAIARGGGDTSVALQAMNYAAMMAGSRGEFDRAEESSATRASPSPRARRVWRPRPRRSRTC